MLICFGHSKPVQDIKGASESKIDQKFSFPFSQLKGGNGWKTLISFWMESCSVSIQSVNTEVNTVHKYPCNKKKEMSTKMRYALEFVHNDTVSQ